MMTLVAAKESCRDVHSAALQTLAAPSDLLKEYNILSKYFCDLKYVFKKKYNAFIKWFIQEVHHSSFSYYFSKFILYSKKFKFCLVVFICQLYLMNIKQSHLAVT